MRKSIRLIAIISLIVVVALFGLSDVSFSYFLSKPINQEVQGDSKFADKSTDPDIIQVGSNRELYLAVRDGQYNNNNQLSSAYSRKTLLLVANIKLTSKLIVTADLNIDLGGYTLDLGGYTMEINHTYRGSLQIYNGKIASYASPTSLILNIPNAVLESMVTLDGVVIDNRISDSQLLLDMATEMVASKLRGDGNSQPYYSESGLAKHRKCGYNMNNHTQCAYVYQDIDLPTNYYGYNLKYQYTSSNSQILSDYGTINMSGVNELATVTLTVNVSIGEVTQQTNYIIHIIDPNNSIARAKMALAQTVEYLERYHNLGTLAGGSEQVSIYKISQSTTLPRYMIDNKAELWYQTIKAEGGVRDSTLAINDNNFKTVNPDTFVIALDENVYKLRVGVVGYAQYIDLLVDGADVSSVKDNYTIALEIAKELYGNELVIKKDTNHGHNGYTYYGITDDMTKWADKGVVGVEYLMSYDIDKTYLIGNIDGKSGRNLYVNPINPPTILQKAGLRMRVKFSSLPEIVSVTVPIRYQDDSDSDGNMIAKFWPYYNYFDRLFTVNSGGYGYETFTMPFNYDSKVVYYYDISYIDNSSAETAAVMTLKYRLDGVDKTATKAQVLAMTNAELTAITKENKAEWTISYVIAEMTTKDIPLTFTYRYKFNDGKGIWGDIWYGDQGAIYQSFYTLAGIIKDNSYASSKDDYIADYNLYKYVYDSAKPTISSPKYQQNMNMFICTAWLDRGFANPEKNSEINNKNNVIGISNYTGLKHLRNIKSLNLDNAKVTNDVTTHIAGMTDLVVLNLANNGLSDRRTGVINLPSGSNNQTLRRLQTLKKLEILHIENNKFYYFSDLQYLTALKEVCVFGNNFTHGSLKLNLFGTAGIVNIAPLKRLLGRSVIIRHISETGEVYKGASGSDEIYEGISTALYQRVMPSGISVTAAYEGLSTDPYEYGLGGKGTAGWWESVPKANIIVFSFEGNEYQATSFIVTYTYYIGSGLFTYYDIPIDYEFDIVRA